MRSVAGVAKMIPSIGVEMNENQITHIDKITQNEYGYDWYYGKERSS